MVMRSIGVNGRPGTKSQVEAVLGPLLSLEKTYQAFALAERALVNTIGVPICMDRCGKCCEVTTVQAWDIEAHFLISWLFGKGSRVRDSVISLCEGWLLDRDRRLPTYGLTGVLSPEQEEKLRPEVNSLRNEMPCPFLSEDKRCIIHEGRPLVCRAYGVTRMAGKICPRPLSRVESEEVRAHIGDNTQVGSKLKSMVSLTLKSGIRVGWSNVRFLATAIYLMVKPKEYNELVSNGKVASAKLVQYQGRPESNPAILFQDHLNQVWDEEQRTSLIRPS